ncbi:MAG TPA: glycosyltransferase family 2 protein [Solirubrobacterales bacterium]|nr:glycosyltransferase family 2 protein [Solirubrobacterales bacterium]
MATAVARKILVRDSTSGVSERLVTLSSAVAHLLPVEICRQYHIVPIEFDRGQITMAGPVSFSPAADRAVREQTGYETRWLFADQTELDLAIDALFAGNGRPEGTSFSTDDLLKHGLAVPPRIGETLASRGLVTEEQLGEAVAEQNRTGSRIGEVLVHGGALEETELLRVLSEQMDMPTVDLSDFDPERAPRDVLPDEMCHRLHCVPIAIDGESIYLAVSDRLVEGEAEVESYSGRKVQQFLASRNAIDQLQRQVNRDRYTQTATLGLRERFPDSSAHQVISGGQKVFLVILLLVFLGFLIWKPIPTMVVVFAVAALYYTATSLYKLIAGYAALGHNYLIDTGPEALATLDERDLPVYTVLVPLFREAAVIPYLVAGIESLDYPKTKLDVRLLCEEDDDETIDAIMALDLPPHFNPIIVPPSQPQTKPKACNFGLLGAKGEYVVIYDAEDRPDPSQLKKAVLMFQHTDDSIVCIQSKLNFFNQQTNILSRWFSIEYSMLFDLVLPGLDARRDPIPLGGTSNHIKLDELLEVGGWDPYNVTEDADLGVRLHQAGYRTTMMDSTTYEEANTNTGNWVRQRSRWIKGYLQTWLVYMRNPFRFLANVGFKGFMSFQLLIGGTFTFLINPIFWFLTTLFALTQLGIIEDFFPGWVYFLAASQLFIGNFVFVYLGLAASVRRGDYSLAPYALFLPLYWGLMSVAAWKGFFQLLTNPFYWEKTEHGLDLGGGAEHAHTATPKKSSAA